ncbi:2,5-didehydrogluconate reductase [Thecamonas trahens ATCC 50062]|uniref:2,5-didehydrogluconate reductase n=1 Tax=Thecamonas trahens ATCC 50062 TaxID=461836 RepID=A0A0L0DQU0_THETB|nr:2,5-didehydrogluconate reductase [Thecamonas trahens ATCC 50062]KNC54645.1 2,5-didehydrogluconate reductase [Thecamonas trahens ATCC 50062]|eukprot:XP_013761550.1 2,5-didehydrogluconate reductase [Thecamonas trahens ATCC 50062]
MPRIGLGMAAIGPGAPSRAAMETALELGYRSFDTAAFKAVWYANEDVVGEVVAEAKNVVRSELFITTKLHPADHGPGAAAAAIAASLRNLRTSYIDLMLIHYPECWSDICDGMGTPDGDWRDSWRVLEAAVEAGTIRSIGVCNFSPRELAELGALARIPVSVVQSRYDVLQAGVDDAVVAAATGIGAVFTAYSPLGGQYWNAAVNPVLSHPTVTAIAAELETSPAHVVLRFLLQRGMTAVPRSTSRAHMAANLATLAVEDLIWFQVV